MFRTAIAHQRILNAQQVEQYGEDYGLVGFKARTETSGFSFSAWLKPTDSYHLISGITSASLTKSRNEIHSLPACDSSVQKFNFYDHLYSFI